MSGLSVQGSSPLTLPQSLDRDIFRHVWRRILSSYLLLAIDVEADHALSQLWAIFLLYLGILLLP